MWSSGEQATPLKDLTLKCLHTMACFNDAQGMEQSTQQSREAGGGSMTQGCDPRGGRSVGVAEWVKHGAMVFLWAFYTRCGWRCRKIHHFLPINLERLELCRCSSQQRHRQHTGNSLGFIFPPGITENFPNTYFISPRRAWPDGNLLREVVHVPHHGRQRPPRYKGKWRGRRTSPEPPRTHGPGFPACPSQAFNAECMVSLKKKRKTHTNI